MAPRRTIRAYYVILGASLSHVIIFEEFFTHHGFIMIFINFRFCPFTQYIKVLGRGRLSKCHKQSPWQRVSRSNPSSNFNIFYCLIFFQSTFEQFKINQVMVIYIHYTFWWIYKLIFCHFHIYIIYLFNVHCFFAGICYQPVLNMNFYHLFEFLKVFYRSAAGCIFPGAMVSYLFYPPHSLCMWNVLQIYWSESERFLFYLQSSVLLSVCKFSLSVESDIKFFCCCFRHSIQPATWDCLQSTHIVVLVQFSALWPNSLHFLHVIGFQQFYSVPILVALSTDHWSIFKSIYDCIGFFFLVCTRFPVMSHY